MSPIGRSSSVAISFGALAHRIRKRIGRLTALVDAADEVREVVAPADQEIAPAFFLPGQLERAKGPIAESNLAHELARARATRVRHAATLAMRFDHALMIDGVVFANGARHEQVFERESLLPRWVGSLPEIDGAALPSSVVGNRYFGHFIGEDSCAAHLAEEYAPVYFTASGTARSAHARRYLEIYGLPLRELRTARLRDAWLFQDFAMTTHKAERYRRMREKVRALPGSRQGHGVFFRRRGAGVPRGLANEAALEARLEREGFEIIDVTRDDVDTIVRRTKDAAVVCGVDGSALLHGVVSMREHGSLMVLEPPHRFTLALKDHSDALGLHFGFVVGVGDRQSFAVSEDELLRTLDLAWARAALGRASTDPALPARRAAGGR